MKIALHFSSVWRQPPAPPADRRRWLLGTVGWRFRSSSASTVWEIEVLWKRFLLIAGLLGATGYLGAVTTVHQWWARQPAGTLRWSDVALAPFRWDDFRRARGESLIATALHQLAHGEMTEAYFGLNAGLARAPRHAAGRLALFRFLAGADRARALRLLEDGIALQPDEIDLLRAYFGFLAANDANEFAARRAGELLAAPRPAPLAPETRRVLTNLHALFLERLGRPAEALDVLRALPADATSPETIRALALTVQALARLDRRAEARAAWDDFRRTPPGGAASPALDAEVALALDDSDLLVSALRRMRGTAAEHDPGALLFAIRAWHQLRRVTPRDLAEQEYLQTFARNERALQLLGAVGVELDLPEIVLHCQAAAAAAGLNRFAFRVHHAEILLRRGEFDEAFRRLALWEQTIATLPPAQRPYPDFIGRLTRASVGGAREHAQALVAHLTEMRGRVRPEMFALAIRVLERAGYAGPAGDTAALAVRLYPLHEGLARQQQQLAAAAPAPVAAPAAPRADPVASGKAALAELDRLIAAGSFTAVNQRLREWRLARPGWFDEVETELGVREVEVAALTGEPLAARFVVRKHLDQFRRPEDALRLLELAAALRARGRETEASLLREEVGAARDTLPAVAAALSAGTPAARTGPVTAEAALAGVDEALARRDPERALSLIEAARKSGAAWLGTTAPELAAREVRARLTLQQRAAAMLAFRDLAAKSGASRSAAFRLVREFIAEGDRDIALLLAREIVRLLPEEKAGATLLREAEAPVPQGD